MANPQSISQQVKKDTYLPESPWIAALFALFVWWFATGAILLVVRRADRAGPKAHLASVLLGLPVAALGAWGFIWSLGEATLPGAYAGFVSALLLWGWAELAFLSGVITGPITRPLRAGVPEWERFLRAWGTIAYHEMLLVLMLIAMGLAAWEAGNGVGFWTFAVLFFARVSAKLNLYLGVRKINTEFLPGPLMHLPSHFRIAQMNWLFPISVTALAFAAACWLERLWAAQSPADAAGFALLAALTALALLEHWLLVLRLPDEKLWRWMLPPKSRRNEDAHGL
jgi:putative photosynthetic complex assembly protein 2